MPQLAAWCYREPAKFWRRRSGFGPCSPSALREPINSQVGGIRIPDYDCGNRKRHVRGSIFLPAAQGLGFAGEAEWCRAALAVLCAYVGVAAATHQKALADLENFAAAHHLQVESLAALPLPPTLTHWAGVISTPEGVWRTTFRDPGGKIESTQLYTEARSDRYIAGSTKLRDVQVYLWFARFPDVAVAQGMGMRPR